MTEQPVEQTQSPSLAQTFNLAELERQTILRALDTTGANRTRAAGLLGISRRTLQRKLKEYGLIRTARQNVQQTPETSGILLK